MAITSPPYWGLRFYNTTFQIWGGDPDCEHVWESYVQKGQSGGTKSPKVHLRKNKDKENYQIFEDTNPAFCSCGAWYGELGNEPTFKLFVSHLVSIFDEIKRILKPHGTIWVNLGDSYYRGDTKEYQVKSMCLVPERFAIGMVEAGWILRNKITWYKPNAMPESVKDRLSRKTEEIYLFSKDPKNFFDLDAVRTPLKASTIERERYTRVPQSGKYFEDINNPNIQAYLGDKRSLEKGANPGDVLKDDTLTQTNEVITMFSKNKKYFFNLDAVKIRSKTYEDDPRCKTEEPIQYNGKSEETSRLIKSPEKRNPGNVLLDSISHDDKIKLKKKYDFLIKKLQKSNLTKEEKEKAKKDIKKAIKLIIKGEIEKFDLVLRGDKSFGGKEGRVKELQENGFYILFRHKESNPGNVYKDFWLTPQSSIRDPGKKGVLGNLGSEELDKLKKKVSYYIEKINNCEKMTTVQKRLATKELKQTANLMVNRKIVDFRLWVRGEKSDLGTRGAELDKKGFFIAYVHKTKNPGDIITNLMDIENTYDHPAVKIYSGLIFSLYEELQTILDKGIDIGTFWSINTQSLAEAHFATFPTTLLETPIKAGCPKFVCKSCGKPKEFECGCETGYRRGIVLDPFIGSGTTGLVSRRLGRDFLGIELQEEYIKIALKRISSDKEGRTHKLGSLIRKIDD
jgi:DNA modification methylase